MSERFRPPIWLWAILLGSTAVSVWIAVDRHRVEASARAVHLAVPIEDIRMAAAASGVYETAALSALRDAGMTAVIVGEETIEQLVSSGKITPAPYLARRGIPAQLAFYIDNRELFERVRSALGNRFPVEDAVPPDTSMFPHRSFHGAVYWRDPASTADVPDLEFFLPASLFDLKNVGTGFDRETCSRILGSGLAVIGRVANPPAATEKSVRWIVEELSAARASGAIFTGDQVLGWEEAIPATAEALSEKDIWYGSVEFGKQAGDRQLASRMLDTHLRVHSVQAAEMPQNTLRALLDRYVRAARERNIRVLLVRPPRPADGDPLVSLETFIGKLKAELIREGSNAKTPQPIASPSAPIWLRAIPAIGALILAMWIWWRVASERWLRAMGLFALGSVSALVAVAAITGRFEVPSLKLSALVAALVFPVWAMVSVFSADNEGGTRLKWVLAYFAACCISIAGGLHVAAMLTSLEYMVQVDQFLGVKVAHFVPPLLVGGYLLFEAMGWRSAAGGSVKWLDVGLFTAIAAALGFTVLRTGNEAPSAVSGWELQARDLLDRIFPERPRTKEAFVGHPALVLALGMAATDRRRYLPLACLVAAIGQASIVNTFCHLHTPIEVSVVRVLTGMITGGIVGIALWLAVQRAWRGRVSPV